MANLTRHAGLPAFVVAIRQAADFEKTGREACCYVISAAPVFFVVLRKFYFEVQLSRTSFSISFTTRSSSSMRSL